MLFTSWAFLFCFLPISILGFGVFCRFGPRAGAGWLAAASLVFYGWFQPGLVVLLGCSIAFNYGSSLALHGLQHRPRLQNLLLAAAIAGNLLALFYYKYAFAFLSFLAGFGAPEPHGLKALVLPLGISFFTFTQIGYLVDTKSDTARDRSVLDYVLFVTFFPHLIAGPVLHHSEMMPQFADRRVYRLQAKNLAAGFTLFTIGLLKKSILADNLADLNRLAFAEPEQLQALGSWGAAVGYALQLYFDFSGYSDMAIGLALVFNLKFPANFNSPFKATSIIDFWQRWHMTLTRYLTLYLYNPVALHLRRRRLARGLSVSRKALESPGTFLSLVAVPTMLIMALAGVWHGAGFVFLVFGVLHGAYLTINHAWRLFGPKMTVKLGLRLPRRLAVLASSTLTLLAVLVADVFFRSDSVPKAMSMLAGMVGSRGFEYPLPVSTSVMKLAGPIGSSLQQAGLLSRSVSTLHLGEQVVFICIGLLIVFAAPNSQQIMAQAQPILEPLTIPPAGLRWRPSFAWALMSGVAAVVALLSLGGTTEFLYFQF